jgi:UDP-N-acetylglucosamine 2-epimerase
MKLISLIGVRSQIIKEAILNQEFEREGIEEILVHSGQHYDFNMSDVFFKVLNIKKADYNLRGVDKGVLSSIDIFKIKESFKTFCWKYMILVKKVLKCQKIYFCDKIYSTVQKLNIPKGVEKDAR